MEYKIIKLDFKGGVHFGNGSLDKSDKTFSADKLFSALCIEAIKKSDTDLEVLVNDVREGKLLLSDAFPYMGLNYYIPKPFVYVQGEGKGDSVQKKRYKKLEYVDAQLLEDYLRGDYPEDAFSALSDFGTGSERTCVSIRGEEVTRPYRVGVYRFRDDAGLYVMVAYQDEAVFDRFLELISGLEAAGIGGKRSAGLGLCTSLQRSISAI